VQGAAGDPVRLYGLSGAYAQAERYHLALRILRRWFAAPAATGDPARALAAAILAEPDFLLLDEPTNNLDRDGRQAVIDLVADWRAGMIVVSHDRELLETLDAIVEMTSLGVTRYGGNWGHYRERKALELASKEPELRKKLWRNVAFMQQRLAEGGVPRERRAISKPPRSSVVTLSSPALRLTIRASSSGV